LHLGPTRIYFLFSAILLFAVSCKTDPPIVEVAESGYPKEIGKIFLTKCGVSGCHNSISSAAAGGLNMETWDKMFEGSRTGSIAIPYNHRQSSLFLFTNTFEELGMRMEPTMPVNQAPLSKEDVLLIRNWIESGAPDSRGFVKFSDNPKRKKIYINNQGCDLVSVIDKETNLTMRYVEVGNKPSPEAPHMIKISPDGQFWYVCFTASDIIQKFRTTDDSFVGEAFIGMGNWNTFAITKDSKTAFVVDWSNEGRIAVVDLERMKIIQTYQGSGLFIQPHGSALSPDNHTLYVTSQIGNYIYKIDITSIAYPEIYRKSLVPGQQPNNLKSLDPHFVEISPDGKSYYVVCQGTNEIRVMDIATDQLKAVIKTGEYPQELVFSNNTDFAFVSCTEDLSSFPGKRGSVTVFNYKTNTFVKGIYTGHQPHGIAVDDETRRVYVAHRNINTDGPAPHHITDCGGRNGYMTIIDINRLDLLSPKRYELSVDPYFIDIRN
jgi:YVTN family beta-propeller protein